MDEFVLKKSAFEQFINEGDYKKTKRIRRLKDAFTPDH